MVDEGLGEEDKGRGEREGQLSSWEACNVINSNTGKYKCANKTRSDIRFKAFKLSRVV